MPWLLAVTTAHAENASCKKVRFADVGWTDIQVTTGTTQTILEALGYEPEVKTLSVPVTYASMKNKDIDVFLGNWMPSMTADIKAYTDDKSVETIGVNLDNAGYGLVVPQYVADAGVKSLTDLGAHKDKFDGKIYGIEAGNDGNRIISGMIAKPENNLAGLRACRELGSRNADPSRKGDEEERMDRVPRLDATSSHGRNENRLS